MKFLDEVTATYAPQRTDDLRPEMLQYVGRSFRWQASWIIEDGPYRGQFAMLAHDDVNPGGRPPYWVPQCDLVLGGGDAKPT